MGADGFRTDIEGLRGIAVLVVVLFHSGIPGFSGGFIGVDIFFALSGYLITRILVAEIETTDRLDLWNFYARRVRRLLPASALTLLLVVLFGAIFLAPQELVFAAKAARASALYASNIFFARDAADYFAPNVKGNPILHTWSLAVEEQFYLFWPLLIMTGLRFWRFRQSLVILLSGLTLASLALSVWYTAHAPMFAFYELPTRAWEFGFGGVAGLLVRGQAKASSFTWLAIGSIGLLAIFGSVWRLSEDSTFPGWIALIPVVGTIAVLIAQSELPHRGIGIVLDSVLLQTLGRLSYSWYLWHWPFLVFSIALFPRIAIGGKLLAVFLALLAAALCQRFIENPIRFNLFLKERPGYTLLLASILTVFSVGATLLVITYGIRLSEAENMKTIVSAVEDIAAIPRQQCVSLGTSIEVKTCSFGDLSSPTILILFGDSHAIQWFNPLQRIATERHWKLITLLKSGCPAADVEPPRNIGDCATWRREALRQLLLLRPSLVVAASATNYMRHEGSLRGHVISIQEWRDGTRRTMQALNNAGIRTVIIRDTPEPSFDVPTCLARFARHSMSVRDTCAFSRGKSLGQPIFEAEMASAVGLVNITFIDLTNQLCDAESCWAVKNEMVVYRDDDHLTGRFAASLAPALGRQIAPLVRVDQSTTR